MGASATAASGTVQASGNATSGVTGAGVTAQSGTVAANIVQQTASVYWLQVEPGLVTVNATATVTGAEATAQSGTVTGQGSATSTVAGAQAAAQFGSVAAQGSATSVVTGAQVSAQHGTVNANNANNANAVVVGAQAISAPGLVNAQGSARGAVNGLGVSAQSGVVAGLAAGVFTISAEQARLLMQLHRLHGLAEPLTVSKTARTAGPLQQAVEDTGSMVTISTTTLPLAYPVDAGLLIEELAALHGLTAALEVGNTYRMAGSIMQSIVATGDGTTVTRQ